MGDFGATVSITEIKQSYYKKMAFISLKKTKLWKSRESTNQSKLNRHDREEQRLFLSFSADIQMK